MSAAAHATTPDQAFSQKYRLYMKVFFALFIITICEVGATFIPGHKLIRDTIICLLACTKAGAVGYYFMHLNHEKKWLRIIAMLPIFMLVYAVALMHDSHLRPAATYLPIRPRVYPVHENHEAPHEEEHEAVAEEAHDVPTPEAPSAPPAAEPAAPQTGAAPLNHSTEAPAAAAPAAPTPPAAGGEADAWK